MKYKKYTLYTAIFFKFDKGNLLGVKIFGDTNSKFRVIKQIEYANKRNKTT